MTSSYGYLAKEDKITIDSQVNLPYFKPKFQSSFDKADKKIQRIFLELVNRFSQCPIEHKTTDKPDYRLVKKYVFCEFVLHPESLQINLRVNNHYISSDILVLKETYIYKPAGNKWYTLKINNEDQLEEASNLIDRVFKFSD